MELQSRPALDQPRHQVPNGELRQNLPNRHVQNQFFHPPQRGSHQMNRNAFLARLQDGRGRNAEQIHNEDDDRIESVDEYNRIITELQDFLTAISDFKKARASHFQVSVLQTLFFLFVTCIFYIVILKIGVTKELFFMALFCNALKDAIYYAKEMQSMRKFEREFKYFLKESFLEQLPQVFEHLFILLQYILIVICLNESFQGQSLFLNILPAPYLMSLICRWLFPYLARRCMHKKRKLEEDYSEEEEYQREKKR